MGGRGYLYCGLGHIRVFVRLSDQRELRRNWNCKADTPGGREGREELDQRASTQNCLLCDTVSLKRKIAFLAGTRAARRGLLRLGWARPGTRPPHLNPHTTLNRVGRDPFTRSLSTRYLREIYNSFTCFGCALSQY